MMLNLLKVLRASFLDLDSGASLAHPTLFCPPCSADDVQGGAVGSAARAGRARSSCRAHLRRGES